MFKGVFFQGFGSLVGFGVLFASKRMGNYIPLPTSSTNFFKNSVGAVGL